MPYTVYKLKHIFGLIFLFLSLGGMCLHAMNGGSKESNASRKILAIGHGVSLLLMLVGGFGLMARLSLTSFPWPFWIWPKILIWLLLGASVAFIYRKPALGKVLWFILPILGVLAASMAIFKPNPSSPPPAPAESHLLETPSNTVQPLE